MAVEKNMVVRVGGNWAPFFGEVRKANTRAKKEFQDMAKAAASVNIGGKIKTENTAAKQLEEVKQQIRTTEEYISALDLKLEEAFRDPGQGEASLAFTTLQKEINATDTKLNQLRGKEIILQVRADTEQAEAAAQGTEAQFSGVEASARAMGAEIRTASGDIRDEMNTAAGSAGRLGDRIRRIAGVGGAPFRAVGNGIKSIRDHMEGSHHGADNLWRSLKRVAGVAVGLKLVSSITGRLCSIVRSYISENSALQAQVNSLKSSMGEALAPAINLVANALSAIMPYIVGVSNAIGQLVTNIFGSGWTTVVSDANAAADATAGAAAAQEEYNRQILGFDKITKLSDNSSSGGGGGGGSIDVGSEIVSQTPAWLTDIADSISAAVENGDWTNVGKTIGSKVSGAISAAKDWLDNTDFGKLASQIVGGINGFMEGALESDTSLGGLLRSFINGAIDFGVTGIEEFDWGAAHDLIAKNIEDFFSDIPWDKLGRVFKGSVDGIFRLAFGDSIVDSWKSMWRSALEKVFGEKEEISTEIIVDPNFNTENAKSKLRQKWGEKIGDEAIGTFNVSPKNDSKGWWDKVKTWWRNQFGTASNNSSGGFGANNSTGSNVLTFPVSPLNNAKSWWESVKAWWKERTGNGTNSAGNFFTRPRNDSKSWWAMVKEWWQERTGNGTNSAGNFFTRPRNDSATWWSSVKEWWQSKIGTNNAGSFSVRPANDSSSWWTQVKAWWNRQSSSGLSVSAKVGLLKDGWKTISEWIGSVYKKISIAVEWKTDGLNTLEAGISKYLFGGKGYPTGLRFAATGGIVTAASLFGNTVVGEAGKEAIVPLERNTEWANIVADKIAKRLGGASGSNQPIHVHVHIGEREVGSTVVNYINRQAATTGVNPLSAYL